jgi:hypothetical protein
LDGCAGVVAGFALHYFAGEGEFFFVVGVGGFHLFGGAVLVDSVQKCCFGDVVAYLLPVVDGLDVFVFGRFEARRHITLTQLFSLVYIERSGQSRLHEA